MIAPSFPSRRLILLLVAVAMMAAAVTVAMDGVPYEPIYHIRPPKNWVNDPNGPYRDPVTGKVHLYMQYNPNGPLWGDIAWYHVTSEDYVKWTRPESPVAVWADRWYDKWGAYSGTMMNNNYSEPVMVYTCTEPENIQRQCIANPPKSDLHGKRTLDTLVKSPLNVIMSEDMIPGIVATENFRDPTEWWQDPASGRQQCAGTPLHSTTPPLTCSRTDGHAHRHTEPVATGATARRGEAPRQSRMNLRRYLKQSFICTDQVEGLTSWNC
ncbi:hypothetical protein LSCM4_07587 [Leishmania orientalis]|uniref:Glycosyl hydrolase family 32 N-terminal domain-containing protein n=1 Tax=Leishmania orientalis TaxID=2249476 RepID=A0A836HPD9_9TRYP|nr:hypothetical protein LSCM4_07587 [Leishmania orientalis]